MTGPKTNERPGTRAVLRGYHMSASKARVVLDLIRGEDVNSAREILALTTREAAGVIGKVLASAVANAVNNDGLSADELYVSAAYADEGVTLKRFSPRARGRAGKIRKRSCHITVVVSRLDDERLEVVRAARSAQASASRARRVSSSRRRADQQASLNQRTARAAQAQEQADEIEETELGEVVEDASVDGTFTPAQPVDVEEFVAEVTEEPEHGEPTTGDDTASTQTTEETDK
ncbi:MAG: 50S ribosomal protein L22 [Acidimicrobiales bacterium]